MTEDKMAGWHYRLNGHEFGRRGSQGASRAAPGKSGLHAPGEGERVLALKSREGTRASRSVEEGLSRSFSGGGASSRAIVGESGLKTH